MKRNISAILLIAMLASLAACGGTDTPADETTGGGDTTAAVTEAPSPLDSLGAKDFGGAVYTIIDGNDYQATYQNLPGESMNGDIINDGLFERGRYMEDHYNVKMEYRVMTKPQACNQTQQSVLAGEKNCDLLISGLAGGGLATLATSGILANLTDYDELALDQPWWSTLMNSSIRMNDRLYMTSGDVVPTMYCCLSCVFLNSSLLADYKLEQDYYSLVREGKWTWDVVKSITADYNRDLNGDDVITAEEDFFGLVYMINEVTTGAAICGSGVPFSTMEKDGIKLDLASERMSAVIDKLSGILLPLSYDNQQACITAFEEGRAIALMHLAASGKNWFREMEDDFMILPNPKYDEAQERYYSYANTWTTAYIGIPLTASDEHTGFITEALARYSYENIRPKFYDLVLKQKAARDEGSGEMLDIIFESAYLDFNAIYDFGKTRSALQQVLFNDAELASSIASAQTAAEAEIENFTAIWSGNE
ncbi:MAG: hypothetical protein IJF67_06925 [Clostridia bacterium]|nr:hypothetical protein [Clostridia bacterium]